MRNCTAALEALFEELPLDEQLDALPAELHRRWAVGELREQRLAEAARTVKEPEPLPPAHAAALEVGVKGVLALLDEDPLAAQRALWDWKLWARPTQLAPNDDDWSIWLILAGRGWGKTRTGVEWIRERVQSGDAKSIGLIGPSISDVWKTLVFGTPDAPGLVRVFPPWERRIEVRRQDRQVVMHDPACGCDGVGCGCPLATIYTAEEPEIRGPNHDTWLCDELAKWRYLQTCWDNIEMTARAVGDKPPRICVTTTPRPLQVIRDLLDDVGVRCTFGSTFANAANVAAKWLARMTRRFGGSRLGLQELFGLVLGDNPDAMFQQSWINDHRIHDPRLVPALVRTIVSVDPSRSHAKYSDLTGIVILGVDARDEVFVLADLTGVLFERDRPGLIVWSDKEPRKHTPDEWGELVCRAAEFYGADTIVVERNSGGDLVQANVLSCWKDAIKRKLVTSPTVKIEEVNATKGKQIRAEPVAALYQQGRIHHVGSAMHDAETELIEWNPKLSAPGKSPGRLDAIVWGTFALLGLGEEDTRPTNFVALAEGNKRLQGQTSTTTKDSELARPPRRPMHHMSRRTRGI